MKRYTDTERLDMLDAAWLSATGQTARDAADELLDCGTVVDLAAVAAGYQRAKRKDEGERMKAESEPDSLHPSSFILHPSSFILHPFRLPLDPPDGLTEQDLAELLDSLPRPYRGQ